MISPVLLMSLVMLILKIGLGIGLLLWLYKIVMDYYTGKKDVTKPVNLNNICWILACILFIIFINMEATYRPTFNENRPVNTKSYEREKKERQITNHKIDREDLKKLEPKVKDWEEMKEKNSKQNKKSIEEFKKLEKNK